MKTNGKVLFGIVLFLILLGILFIVSISIINSKKTIYSGGLPECTTDDCDIDKIDAICYNQYEPNLCRQYCTRLNTFGRVCESSFCTDPSFSTHSTAYFDCKENGNLTVKTKVIKPRGMRR